MGNISFKIAFPVILAGIFTIVVFMALNPEGLSTTFYIMLTLLFIFIFFYGLSTGQKLAMPVKKLLKRAIDLSRGDLKTRFYLETKDEFGQLAQIFNKIADDLEQSRENTANSEKSVDIKVKAKTQALEETIDSLEQKVRNRTVELEKLLADAKTRESETAEMREELNSLRTRLGKSRAKKSGVKKETEEVSEEVQEEA